MTTTLLPHWFLWIYWWQKCCILCIQWQLLMLNTSWAKWARVMPKVAGPLCGLNVIAQLLQKCHFHEHPGLDSPACHLDNKIMAPCATVLCLGNCQWTELGLLYWYIVCSLVASVFCFYFQFEYIKLYNILKIKCMLVDSVSVYNSITTCRILLMLMYFACLGH